MKKEIAVVLLLLSVQGLIAQPDPCSTLLLKEGTQLVYTTKNAPPPMYKFKGEYYKASAKEQQKMKEKFDKENPMINDIQVNRVSLMNNTDGTIELIYKSTKNSQQGVVTEFRAYCKHDTLINRPGYVLNNNGNIITSTYYNVNPNGFTMLFEKATPNKLQVGQKLPDQKSMFIFSSTEKNVKFPMLEEVGKEITSYGGYNSRGRWEEMYNMTISKFDTKMVDVIIQSAVTNEVLIKNRMVKDKKEVSISGKTFTAFQLYEETWTGSGTYEVKSDNPFVNKHNEKFSDKMSKRSADALRKLANANEEGYIVTKTESWYIPGLGAYSMTSYDETGSIIGYLELKEIK